MEPIVADSATTSAEQTKTLDVVAGHIGVKPGYCGGKPHILGHRIKVQHVVVWHERMGMSPTEIILAYPSIRLSDVHAALAYYYDHRSEIDADIVEYERQADEIEARYPSQVLEKARRENVKNDSLSPG